jgi:DNA-3-methyladenine glycosylase II
LGRCEGGIDEARSHLRKLIPQFGDLHLVGRGEPFTTLARSIVGQQISVKAAESVWTRFLELCPKCTPARC